MPAPLGKAQQAPADRMQGLHRHGGAVRPAAQGLFDVAHGGFAERGCQQGAGGEDALAHQAFDAVGHCRGLAGTGDGKDQGGAIIVCYDGTLFIGEGRFG